MNTISNCLTGAFFIWLLLVKPSSCSTKIFFGCCKFSSSNLDEEVHNPSERRDTFPSKSLHNDDISNVHVDLRPENDVQHENFIASSSAENKYLNGDEDDISEIILTGEFEYSPRLKPSLKKSSMDKSTSTASVSFAIDTKETVVLKGGQHPTLPSISSLIKAKHVSTSKSISKLSDVIAIMPENSFDYNVQGTHTLQDISHDRDMYEILMAFFPGIEDVSMTQHDLIGMAMFISLYAQPIAFFRQDSFSSFLQRFFSEFPGSIDIISVLQAAQAKNKKISRPIALEALLFFAFENSLYYTVEAFYLAYAVNNEKLFLKFSIEFGNISCFLRFLQLCPDVKTEEIFYWALKYENVTIYLNYMNFPLDLKEVQHFFMSPIIINVSKLKVHFPGLIELIRPIEEGYFDLGLMSAIQSSNCLLFKDLIRLGNDDGLFPSLNPVVFAQLEVLFDRVTNYEELISLQDDGGEMVLMETLSILLLLDCDDLMILESFELILSNPGLYEIIDINELFKSSAFMSCREYFKLILKHSQRKIDFIFKVDSLNIGIWKFIDHSLDYKEMIYLISKSSSFDVLHAVGNPRFPDNLWKSSNFENEFFIVDFPFQELAEIGGFNPDFLNESDMLALGIHDKVSWNLLELALLNFNYKAFGSLSEKYFNKLDKDEALELYRLATAIHELVLSKEYAGSHSMTYTIAISKQLALNRIKYPTLYEDGPFEEKETHGSLVQNLRISMDFILNELKYKLRSEKFINH